MPITVQYTNRRPWLIALSVTQRFFIARKQFGYTKHFPMTKIRRVTQKTIGELSHSLFSRLILRYSVSGSLYPTYKYSGRDIPVPIIRARKPFPQVFYSMVRSRMRVANPYPNRICGLVCNCQLSHGGGFYLKRQSRRLFARLIVLCSAVKINPHGARLKFPRCRNLFGQSAALQAGMNFHNAL